MARAPTPPSGVRGHAIYALYLLVVIGVASVAAGWLVLREVHSRIDQEVQIVGNWFLQFDPTVGVRIGDRISTQYIEPLRRLDFHIYSDGRGLRVAARGNSVASPVDVLVVGGSFFFGWGIEAEQSVSARLAELTNLRVANAATPATGTQSAALTVRRLRELEPRVVVYGLIDDHVRRNTCPCASTVSPFCQAIPYVRADATGRLEAAPPVDSIFTPAEGTRRAYLTFTGSTGLITGSYWAVRSLLGLAYRRIALSCDQNPEIGAAALMFSLDRLSSETRALGAELIVAYVPPLGGMIPGPPAPVEEIARREDLIFLDLDPALRAHAADPERRWTPLILGADPHPSAAGHALFATELCRVLRERGYAEPGPCSHAVPRTGDAKLPGERRSSVASGRKMS